MISFIKDLPDWAVGAATAGALWVSVSYVVLAPRAMDAHAMGPAAESCMVVMEREQAAKTDAVKERYQTNRNAAEAQLHDDEHRLRQIQAAMKQFDRTGFPELARRLGMDFGGSVELEIQALSERIRVAKRALSVIPDFAKMATPSAELRRLCSCAALQTIANSRTSYAMSIASFRLMSPDDLRGASDVLAEIAKGGACAATGEGGAA